MARAGRSADTPAIHLDTDFGGDPDDACALAMLLGWPGVELLGITTNFDGDGRRAGCAEHYLRLAGRVDIPVRAGAAGSMTTLERYESTWGDERYWPVAVEPRPGPAGAALDLLAQSIERGATVVAVGGLTNLALLEVTRPGALDGVRVVVMGGWVGPPETGLPQWGPDMDWNIQCDTRAAEIVVAKADVVLVTLPVTLGVHLRARDLRTVADSGPVGELLARQSTVHGEDRDMAALARAHEALPDDLVNFHWDPAATAVAVGWPGARIEEMNLVTRPEGGVVRFERTSDPEAGGRPAKVVVEIDGEAFTDAWLGAVTRLGACP